MPMDELFDYVIVGGGTAAGIVAYRLGEAGHTVCVLEAGPADNHPYLRIPAGFNKTLFDPRFTWQLKSDPDPGINGRQIAYTQGKVLGGSGSVNGMIYNRGQSGDYDGWAQAGNSGWSYEDILPYFRRTERREANSVDPAYRGRDGRLTVVNAPWPNIAVDAFIEAAVLRGHPRNPDHNAASQWGAGYWQSSIERGWRASTSTAFLKPARKRFGVAVRTMAQVLRIELEGRRAARVVYRTAGGERTVAARGEVILSAGAVHSPKLLQLSGIGPGALLAGHGIAVRHDLPGVGENFRDHFGPRLVARARPGVDSINLHTRGLPLARQLLLWALGRPSILALSPARGHLFGKSDPAMDAPDYTLMFAPASFKAGLVGVLDDFPGITVGAWPMRPQSSGYVRIASADPDSMPHINARYLTDPVDQRVQVAAMRAARAIMATEPLAGLIDAELFPGPDCQSDEEMLEFARSFGATSFHLAGSCKMGPASDLRAVVDPRLRVHGIAGLRVIDSSIMPTIVSGNTAAATMMIAEKGSDMILEDAA
jgi:choline dehydrogenase